MYLPAVLCVFFALLSSATVKSIGVQGNNKKCLENEEFTECYSACESKCGLKGYQCDYKNCVPGCRCIEDYARNSTGQCILHSDCPCGENEIFDSCNSHCSPKCEDPHGIYPCILICVAGCRCAKGFAEDANGKCLQFSDCPGYQKCPKKNEVYRKCKIDCGKTCQNPQVPKCDLKCKIGCVCEENYLKDEITGECVLEEKCIKDLEN